MSSTSVEGNGTVRPASEAGSVLQAQVLDRECTRRRTSGQRIVTPRLERFLLDRFATTLEDPRTGRKMATRATEMQS